MDYYSKSGRQPFFKLLLSGLLFMVFGNLLCTIVTVSTAPFMNFEFFKVIVFILTLIIFYSLMFTAGYRDGDRAEICQTSQGRAAQGKQMGAYRHNPYGDNVRTVTAPAS